jgi:hypothetical protein
MHHLQAYSALSDKGMATSNISDVGENFGLLIDWAEQLLWCTANVEKLIDTQLVRK